MFLLATRDNTVNNLSRRCEMHRFGAVGNSNTQLVSSRLWNASGIAHQWKSNGLHTCDLGRAQWVVRSRVGWSSLDIPSAEATVPHTSQQLGSSEACGGQRERLLSRAALGAGAVVGSATQRVVGGLALLCGEHDFATGFAG